MKYIFIIVILTFYKTYADPQEALFAGKIRVPSDEPALIRLYEIFSRDTALSAEFTQKTFVKALNKELVSKGRLIFVQDKGVMWETRSPFKQRLYITKDGEVYEKDKSSPVGVFRYAGLLSEMINSGVDKISNAFDVYFSGNEKKWSVGLKPIKRVIGKYIKSIVITGDQNGKITEVSVMGNDIKITEINFQNHQIPSIEELNRIHEIFKQK